MTIIFQTQSKYNREGVVEDAWDDLQAKNYDELASLDSEEVENANKRWKGNKSIMKKVEHPDDCIRVRNALLELGYDLNLYECERFWRAYSKKQGIEWIIIKTHWFKQAEEHLRDEIGDNLNILSEIPFLPRG